MAKKNKKGSVDFSSYTPQGKRRQAKENAGANQGSTNKKGLIIGVIVLAAIIIAAAVAYNVLTSTVSPSQQIAAVNPTGASEQGMIDASGNATAGNANIEQEKTEAPNFTMEDSNGGTVSLEGFRGKPVVLNFWASTCGPCKREMPEFQTAFEEHGDDIQFVMVNVPGFNGETAERTRAFLDQSGFTFPVYYDSTGQGQMTYGITSIPRTFFINADGELEAYAQGSIDKATIQQGLEMLL